MQAPDDTEHKSDAECKNDVERKTTHRTRLNLSVHIDKSPVRTNRSPVKHLTFRPRDADTEKKSASRSEKRANYIDDIREAKRNVSVASDITHYANEIGHNTPCSAVVSPLNGSFSTMSDDAVGWVCNTEYEDSFNALERDYHKAISKTREQYQRNIHEYNKTYATQMCVIFKCNTKCQDLQPPILGMVSGITSDMSKEYTTEHSKMLNMNIARYEKEVADIYAKYIEKNAKINKCHDFVCTIRKYDIHNDMYYQ